jgi:hypothetical protein
MRRILLAAASLAALTATSPPASASSHREAPMIAGMPRLDGTDFYLFRSYEPGRSDYVTMIANYLPLQDPYGGPNFFPLDHDGYYDINLDTDGSGTPTYTLRFRFSQVVRNLALTVGGKSVAIPLINAGQITSSSNAAQNVLETYTVSLVTYRGGNAQEQLLGNAGGQTVFARPADNIGNKSIPDYAAYAANFTYEIAIPGCSKHGRVFVGQRADPFVANLGETFDLVNYANPVGEQFAATKANSLANKSVTSIVTEAPIDCLTRASGDPVIGGWTTSSRSARNDKDENTFRQVSRLGNPLVNELVIGLPDKDKFNHSLPKNDAQFAKYVTNPTVPALIEALFGTPAPTAFPRQDLVAVFLTGVAGLNAPAHLQAASEEMRLNTSIAPTPYGAQSRLGVIGGDNAGYPNGRRPGDDVVDITLRVAMGRLYTLGVVGTPADAPSGKLDFTDGAYVDSTQFMKFFPYVNPPLSPSPSPAAPQSN